LANFNQQYIGLALTDREVKDMTGWPDQLVQDYTSTLNSLRTLAAAIEYMQVGAGSPEGVATSNASRQYFDTAAGALYCNTSIGVSTGWVAV
jgi:hypothetical protein